MGFIEWWMMEGVFVFVALVEKGYGLLEKKFYSYNGEKCVNNLTHLLKIIIK